MKRFLSVLILISICSLTVSQNNEDHLYINAKIQYDNKNYTKAIQFLNEILTENDKDPKIYIKLGDCYKNLSDYELAVENYANAVTLKENIGLYKIAQVYSLNKEAQKSTEYLKEFLQTNDKLSEQEIKSDPELKTIENTREWNILWKNEFYSSYEKKLSEAKYLISYEKYDDAYEILDNLLYKNKNRHQAIVLRADLLMLNKEYKNAAKEYSKASEIKRKNLTYKEKAANAYYLNGNYKTALRIYTEIYEKETFRTELLMPLSELHFHLKNIDEAVTYLKKYITYYPKAAEAHYLLGKINTEKGNDLSALEQYNKCLSYDKTKYIYFVERADILAKLDQSDAAVYDYSMALDLEPTNGEIYYKRALVYLKEHYYNEACLDFQKAKELNYHKSNDYIIKFCK